MKTSASLLSYLSRAALRRALFMVLSTTLLISSVLSAHEMVWRQTYPAGTGRYMAKLDNGDIIVGGDDANDDFRIFRINGSNGSVVWTKSYNGINDDTLYDLIADPATGDVYFCGTQSPQATTNNFFNNDWYVQKLNGTTGNPAWASPHTFGYDTSADHDAARKLSFVQDGNVKNIVVVGTAQGLGGRIVKLEAATGAVMWHHTTPTTTASYYDVVTHTDGSIYAGGEIANPYATAVIRKYNVGSATPVWTSTFADNGGVFNRWQYLAVDPASGDVITAGLISGPSAGTTVKNDIGIARYRASDGQRQWMKLIDGSGASDQAEAVIVDGNYVYVSGTYRISSSNVQWFIGCFSLANGDEIWRLVDGGNGTSTGDNIENIQIKGSTLYATGSFNNTDTGRNLVLMEIAKSTGDIIEKTVFTERVGAIIQGGNRSVIITDDGQFIVAGDNGTPTAPEIARYGPDGGSEPPDPVAPSITTPTHTSVAVTTATLGGNVTTDGGAAITERGVVYSLTSVNSNPEIGGAGVTKVAGATPHGTGVFTVGVTNLTAASGYTYKAYAQNSVGTTYTSSSSFTTTGSPVISVTGNSAAIANGSTSVSESNHTVFVTTNVSSGSNSRTFSINNSGTANLTLAPGAVTVNGSEFTLVTPPTSPVVPSGSTSFTVTFDPASPGVKTTTVSIASNDPVTATYTFAIEGAGTDKPSTSGLNVTAIKGYSATLNASVNPNGLATTYSFEYATNAAFSGSTTTTSSNLGVSAFVAGAASTDITGLLPETTYHYRVVSVNNDGTTTSSSSSFSTGYAMSTNEPLTSANGMPGGGQLYRPTPGVINNAGRILFQSIGLVGTGTPAVTSSNDEWLMTDAAGIPRVILREGNQLGSESGQLVSGLFNHLLLGESGESFISEKINGATTDKDYTYLVVPETADSVSLISQEGDTAPDGGVFINSVGKPALDSQGRFYFQGSLSGVATALASGVWYDAGEGLATLIQAGTDISTSTGDPAWLGKVSNILAAGGNGTSFVAALQANPADNKQKTDTQRSQAIVSANVENDEVVISIVARKGDLVSGGSTINTINGLARGVNEHHAFIALMKTGGTTGVANTNDEILATVVEGATVIIAREGTTVLDGGLTPKSFGDFYVTDTGDVIFQAVLNGAPATSDGILCRWNATTGTVVKLAREGDAAPGTSLNYGTLHTVGVSDNGNIVLQTILSDGKHGLHRNTGSGFQLVVKASPTDTVDFYGSTRSILSISLYTKTTGTGGGGGGMGSSINNNGDIFTVLSIGSGDYVTRIYRGTQSAPQ